MLSHLQNKHFHCWHTEVHQSHTDIHYKSKVWNFSSKCYTAATEHLSRCCFTTVLHSLGLQGKLVSSGFKITQSCKALEFLRSKMKQKSVRALGQDFVKWQTSGSSLTSFFSVVESLPRTPPFWRVARGQISTICRVFTRRNNTQHKKPQDMLLV